MKKVVKPVSKGKKASSTTAEQPPLEREEWDFEKPPKGDTSGYTGCPEDELFDCYEYEYSRTLAIAERAKRAQKSQPSDQRDKRMNRFYELFADDFPATPWLKINPADRQIRLMTLNAEWPTMPPFSPVSVESLQKDGALHNELEWVELASENVMATILPVRLAWQFSNREIADAVEAWLDKFRPVVHFPLPRRSGKDERSQIRTALKALGAYRLLQKRMAKDAEALSKQLRGASLFKSDKGWSEAKGDALKIISSWKTPARAALDFYPVPQVVEGITEDQLLSTVLITGLRRWLAYAFEGRQQVILHSVYKSRMYFKRAMLIPNGSVRSVPFSLTEGLTNVDKETIELLQKHPFELCTYFDTAGA